MGLKTIKRTLSAYFRFLQFLINIRLTRDKLKRHGQRIGGRILDIGAGDQPYRDCFPRAKEYVATNKHSHYGEQDSENIASFTDVWLDDAKSLPFKTGSFDAVLCFQVLSLVAEPQALFAEAARVLRPGGLFVLTTDFLYPKWDNEDLMRHTDRHLTELAKASGLIVETMESTGGVFAMIHCCLTRYIRGYPQRVTSASGIFSRALKALVLIFYLGITPFYSIAGYFIYLAERKQNNEFAYTVNSLVICRKQNAG